MAGDWIKMRGNLWDDPRVGRLCDLTGNTECCVIGALYWLWSTADQHTEDGVLPGLSLRQIDRKTGVDGFGDAMCSIGWVADHPDGVRLVRFEEHNGKSAKRRLLTAQRVAKHKANAEVTQTALPKSRDGVSGALPREEKSKRKTKETPPIPPKGGRAPAVTLGAWLDAVKSSGQKPIPEDDPVFSYAEGVCIPAEFLRLAWLEFRHRYTQPEAKRYRDWRAVFRKAVRGNWLKVWFLDPASNQYGLTTVGLQAQRAHQERRQA
jgi:hypothetical protein